MNWSGVSRQRTARPCTRASSPLRRAAHRSAFNRSALCRALSPQLRAARTATGRSVRTVRIVVLGLRAEKMHDDARSTG